MAFVLCILSFPYLYLYTSPIVAGTYVLLNTYNLATAIIRPGRVASIERDEDKDQGGNVKISSRELWVYVSRLSWAMQFGWACPGIGTKVELRVGRGWRVRSRGGAGGREVKRQSELESRVELIEHASQSQSKTRVALNSYKGQQSVQADEIEIVNE